MAKTNPARPAQSKKSSPAREPRSGKGATAQPVAVDRRERGERADRRKTERRQQSEPVAVERRQLERREKVNRRRQIDPTTCEREYSDAEVEFMNALDVYKRKSGRMFPTCSEILEVIVGLGYRKMTAAGVTPDPVAETPSSESGISSAAGNSDV